MKVLALCAFTLFAGVGAGYTIQDKVNTLFNGQKSFFTGVISHRHNHMIKNTCGPLDHI